MKQKMPIQGCYISEVYTSKPKKDASAEAIQNFKPQTRCTISFVGFNLTLVVDPIKISVSDLQKVSDTEQMFNCVVSGKFNPCKVFEFGRDNQRNGFIPDTLVSVDGLKK